MLGRDNLIVSLFFDRLQFLYSSLNVPIRYLVKGQDIMPHFDCVMYIFGFEPAECIFRPKSTSHSGASRPLIPGHSVQ
jgi:hypothetical protein